ncbi:MAG: YkvA family protein [Pyrinomonadaceae bacterium]
MAQTKMARAADEPREGRIQAKSRMKNLLTFFPNMVKLCGRLLTDKRVSTADKALLAGAIVYAIMPFDLIPDMIPFVGQMDDAYLIALALLRIINHTDESVVRENWTGGGDIVALAGSIANIAPMLLPKRISRVLTAKVELTDAGKAVSDVVNKKQPLVVERPPELESGKK